MTASQVLLKYAGQHAAGHEGLIAGFAGNPWLWMAMVASAGGICGWLLALRDLPLAAAYPWTALIYVLTPTASVWLFAEAVGARYLAGMVLILFGVVLTTRSVRPQ